jgi:hypothetical protein
LQWPSGIGSICVAWVADLRCARHIRGHRWACLKGEHGSGSRFGRDSFATRGFAVVPEAVALSRRVADRWQACLARRQGCCRFRHGPGISNSAMPCVYRQAIAPFATEREGGNGSERRYRAAPTHRLLGDFWGKHLLMRFGCKRFRHNDFDHTLASGSPRRRHATDIGAGCTADPGSGLTD